MKPPLALPAQTFPTALLVLLLSFSTLAIGRPERWPAALVQCGILVMGAAACWRLGRAPRVGALKATAPLAGVAVWGLVQLAAGRAVYRYATWSAVLDWTAIACLFAVGLALFSEPGARRRFLRMALGFSMVVALMTLLAPLTGDSWKELMGAGGKDFLGPFANRNNYAAFVELMLPVAMWRAFSDRGQSWVGACGAALLYATVIASGSRAGAVLVTVELVGLIAMGWLLGTAPTRRLVIAGLWTASLGTIFTAVAGWGLLAERLALADPLLHRREIYRSTLAMIAEHPWTGFGLGSFETVYPRFRLFDNGLVVNFAHNDWLQWGAEMGLPALALLMAGAVASIRPALRSLWGAGVVFVYLHALVDFPMQRPGVALWVAAMLSAVAAAGIDQRRRPCRSKESPIQANVAEAGAGEAVAIEEVSPVDQKRRAHGLGQ